MRTQHPHKGWLQHERKQPRQVSHGLTSPFSQLANLEGFFGDWLKDFDVPALHGDRGTLFNPRLDIKEEDKHYFINIETPGVDQGDINIRLDGDILTIKGEKKYEQQESDKKSHYHRIERSYGNFQRSLCLPADADPQQVNATSDNGVLSICIAKKEVTTPDSREVEIKVE